ncbi:hypothetical protein BC829DRAFT_426046 [Chytridium lagenaria]|nr:hypothetical protein BC829DRAFT_426046 [Chytridium lagenaria]
MKAPTAFFTAEEVATHRTTRSTWITFVNDHPGGADLVLQFGGQDATAIMKDHSSHEHSDAAYSMLDDFYIGQLEVTKSVAKVDSALALNASITSSSSTTTTSTSSVSIKSAPVAASKVVEPVASLFDVNKPMLAQVFFGNFSKDFYMEQVHIPRTCKGSAPIFGSTALEIFTKTPWWVIPAVYIPISFSLLYSGITGGLTTDAALCWFALGIFIWTLIEYTLHRFLFHVDEYLPDHRIAITFALFVARNSPLFANGQGNESYHLDHHYKNAHLGYGITSKLWDHVFNTVLL